MKITYKLTSDITNLSFKPLANGLLSFTETDFVDSEEFYLWDLADKVAEVRKNKSVKPVPNVPQIVRTETMPPVSINTALSRLQRKRFL